MRERARGPRNRCGEDRVLGRAGAWGRVLEQAVRGQGAGAGRPLKQGVRVNGGWEQGVWESGSAGGQNDEQGGEGKKHIRRITENRHRNGTTKALWKLCMLHSLRTRHAAPHTGPEHAWRSGFREEAVKTGDKARSRRSRPLSRNRSCTGVRGGGPKLLLGKKTLQVRVIIFCTTAQIYACVCVC